MYYSHLVTKQVLLNSTVFERYFMPHVRHGIVAGGTVFLGLYRTSCRGGTSEHFYEVGRWTVPQISPALAIIYLEGDRSSSGSHAACLPGEQEDTG